MCAYVRVVADNSCFTIKASHWFARTFNVQQQQQEMFVSAVTEYGSSVAVNSKIRLISDTIILSVIRTVID